MSLPQPCTLLLLLLLLLLLAMCCLMQHNMQAQPTAVLPETHTRTHLLWHQLSLLHELLHLLPQLTAAVNLISQQVTCSRTHGRGGLSAAVAGAASTPHHQRLMLH
jgi:hypothetical protein